MSDIIWEFPIYCCTQEEWLKIKELYISNVTQKYRTQLEQNFLRRGAGQWRYNWRIGYLTLQLDKFNAPRIFESLTTSKKISSKSPTQKPIYDFGNNKVADISIKPDYSNSQIYQNILSALKNYKTKFYLDLETFEKCGPCIDWQKLLHYKS